MERIQSQAVNQPVHQALAEIKHIVAIASGKGGVGKSTVATNLAVALSSTGDRVGLLDADIYGPSQPGMLGSENAVPKVTDNMIQPVERHGIGFVSMGLLMDDDAPAIWRAPIAMKMIHQFLGNVRWGKLDYLLIDLPPGTGDVQLTLAQQASLTGAIIVTTPQRVALGVARKGLMMFEQVDVPIIGVLENMSGFTCRHCGKDTEVFKTGGGELMARKFGVPFLGSLPLDPAIMMSGDDGIPVLKQAPDSGAARALLDLAGVFRREVEKVAAESSGGPDTVEIESEGDLVVQWPDGHRGRHQPYNLRIHCCCAGCVDEDSGQRTLDPGKVPLDVKIKGVKPVGRYALSFEFSDGHQTGIYRFDLLRELCECDECSRKRQDGVRSFSA